MNQLFGREGFLNLNPDSSGEEGLTDLNLENLSSLLKDANLNFNLSEGLNLTSSVKVVDEMLSLAKVVYSSLESLAQ